jgi:hypothetical protein
LAVLVLWGFRVTASGEKVAVERIEEQHLRNIIGIGLKQSPSRDETAVRYFMATVLLRHYLGTTWSDECDWTSFRTVVSALVR